MAKQRRHEHKPKTKPKVRHKVKPKPKKKAPTKKAGQPDTTRLQESGQFPAAMPADQQAGLDPQDYPDYAATFGTGPGQAVQYHYSREDLYNEQYAQEQLAAMQSKGAATATVPGPGQIGVSYG